MAWLLVSDPVVAVASVEPQSSLCVVCLYLIIVENTKTSTNSKEKEQIHPTIIFLFPFSHPVNYLVSSQIHLAAGSHLIIGEPLYWAIVGNATKSMSPTALWEFFLYFIVSGYEDVA